MSRCVGVVVALAAERRSLDTTGTQAASVLAMCAGVGPACATRAAVALLERGADVLVSWGCAGALSPELSSGALVVPGEVVGAGDGRWHVDAGLQRRVRATLAGAFEVHGGALAEARAVIVRPEAKRGLAESSGAVAVDMESAAIARVAAQRDVPFVAVRAVADTVDQSLPAVFAERSVPGGRVEPVALAVRLLARPRQWGGCWRAARSYRAACASLRRAAAGGVLEAICAPPSPGCAEELAR